MKDFLLHYYIIYVYCEHAVFRRFNQVYAFHYMDYILNVDFTRIISKCVSSGTAICRVYHTGILELC